MTDRVWQVARVGRRTASGHELHFSRPEFCRRCQAGSGCGAGIFAGLFPRRDLTLAIDVDGQVSAGQWVRVGIARQTVALAAALAYGLPLLGFVLGMLPAWWLMAGEAPGDLVSLAGGLAGAVLVYWLGKRHFPLQWNLEVEPLSCDQDQAGPPAQHDQVKS